MADAKFQLIDLNTEYAFEFPFFPENIRLNDVANWLPQDTAFGKKPIFYANNEPRTINIDELILDHTQLGGTTIGGTSLKPTLDLLRLHLTAFEDGAPSPQLAVWGDHSERVVLTKLDIEEIYFNENGEPTRARISMELTELQEEGEATDVNILEESDEFHEHGEGE